MCVLKKGAYNRIEEKSFGFNIKVALTYWQDSVKYFTLSILDALLIDNYINVHSSVIKRHMEKIGQSKWRFIFKMFQGG